MFYGEQQIMDKQTSELNATAPQSIDPQTTLELEAAAFRTLVAHFDAHPEVQNIDLMNLAGFCRNCLSKWYKAAAEDKGIALDYEEARRIVYGMPYAEWKALRQAPASAAQLAAFDANKSSDA
jgi:uncharacterized protein